MEFRKSISLEIASDYEKFLAWAKTVPMTIGILYIIGLI